MQAGGEETEYRIGTQPTLFGFQEAAALFGGKQLAALFQEEVAQIFHLQCIYKRILHRRCLVECGAVCFVVAVGLGALQLRQYRHIKVYGIQCIHRHAVVGVGILIATEYGGVVEREQLQYVLPRRLQPTGH